MPRGPTEWSWVGACVLFLVICLGGGWATALVMSASARTPPITDSTKDLLGNIGGGLVGVVGAYVGSQVVNRRKKDRDDEGPPPP